MDLNWDVVLGNLYLLGIAYVLAMPVAWDRENATRSAGLRTFPLVSVAACGYVLVTLSITDSMDSVTRVIAAVIAGMGFIGGGAILKSGNRVRGTATAASLWLAGIIGIAVSIQRFEIALVLALLNFATLRLVTPFKENDSD